MGDWCPVGGVVLPRFVAQSMAEPQVIVVGAGLAGIAAALELQRKNVVVVVLEARDVAGGRVRSASLASTKVDMGAHWLHGTEGVQCFEGPSSVSCHPETQGSWPIQFGCW